MTSRKNNTRGKAPEATAASSAPQTDAALAPDGAATIPAGMSVPAGDQSPDDAERENWRRKAEQFWLPSKALDAVQDAFRDRAWPLTEEQLLRIATIVREPVAETQLFPGEVPATFEAFEVRFPRVTALYASWPAPDQDFGISITATRDGFRRGDLVHGKAAEVYGAGDITPEQLEAILAEPVLTVELV